MGKTNASVACSALNNSSTGFNATYILDVNSYCVMCCSHSPTLLLRVKNYTDSGTVLDTASRVLEFSLPIYLTSRLLRERLKIDLIMVLERIPLFLHGDLLTNGVFPTAPVKPSTAMLLVANPLACWATVDRKPDSMMSQRENQYARSGVHLNSHERMERAWSEHDIKRSSCLHHVLLFLGITLTQQANSKRIQLYPVIDILIARYAHMANYTVIMYEGWDQRAEPSIKMQR
jgi:hypothetical protein